MSASNASATTVAKPGRRRSTRLRRIIIEFLAPPLVATVLAAISAVLREPGAIPTIPWSEFLGGVLAVLVGAYVVAAIPSAVFTIVMEVAFSKGLDPASWPTVPLAAGLGLLSGMAVVGFDPSYGAFVGLSALGTVTGAIVGLLVRAGERRTQADQ